MRIQRANHCLFDFTAIFHHFAIDTLTLFLLQLLQIARFLGNPARQCHQRLDRRLGQPLVAVTQILRQDIAQSPRPTVRNECHRCQAALKIVATSILAQGCMEISDIFQNFELERIGQAVKFINHPAQTSHRFPADQRLQNGRFFRQITALQSLDQQVVSSLIL